MMSELLVTKPSSKKSRTLTPRAFAQLLKWLDRGANSEGQNYLEMRERLVAYFDRKNCAEPDELADETLNRVALRLEAEGTIESDPPAKYCYIVARFIFMENLRAAQKENQLVADLRRERARAEKEVMVEDDEPAIKERRLACLEQCTAKLDAANCRMIIRYYTGRERVKIDNRRALAEELKITMNALSIRACRIRERLEACVRQCMGARVK